MSEPVVIPDVIKEWNPRVVPIGKGRKGPTVPKWTETQVRARDIEFGPDHDKYGIVLDADTLVIDIDVHDDAKNGYAALERLSKDCGVDLLDVAAFVVESPSGGRHLYFSKPEDLKLPKSTQEYPGLDFLTAGCQVIGAGSQHVDGGEYAIETSPEDVPVSEAPLPNIAPFLSHVPASAPETSPLPPQKRTGLSPLDEFNKSPEALQYVKAAMEGKGYRLIYKGDGTFEFVRPGKRESSHSISGTLGKSRSKSGNLLLKNFSSSDPIFSSTDATTLSEAFRLLENHTREALPRLLRDFGFGEDNYSTDLSDIKILLGSQSEAKDIVSSYPQLTLAELAVECPERRPYVIEGLLRQGETMNIVASPKTGKSWFVYNLAITLANGGEFLGWTSPSNLKCLLVDNELHANELVWRLKTVEEALDSKAGDSLRVSSLRGSGLDIGGLEAMMSEIGASQYDVIILDALYRFLPEGTSENDNAQMMAIYNALDRIGRTYGCSIIVVHHASKGEQSSKSITDIGAGAGSITRAADSQVVLLPHEVSGLVCVEAFTRSSRTPEPFTAALEDGKWRRIDAIEPERKQTQKPNKGDKGRDLRATRAAKVRQYFQDNEKISSEQGELVFGEETSRAAVNAFMKHLRSIGATKSPYMGWHGKEDGWEEKITQWIADDCPT